MHLITKVSQHHNIEAAVSELTENVDISSLSTFVVYYTDNYDVALLSEALKQAFPDIPFCGCSSCKGIMTDQGFFDQPVIALMGIYDSGMSAYGTGFADLKQNTNDIGNTVSDIIQQALLAANRVGEVPSLVILHSTPGNEEQIINHIDATFGSQVPIVGGSAAASFKTDNWSVISNETYSDHGIALSLLFPSKSVSSSFSAGYSPTSLSGTVTKADGRILHEIDGKSASSVYKEWLKKHSDMDIGETVTFGQITRFPLGRIADHLYGQPYYKLTHPFELREESTLKMFSDIENGDTITLMTGHKEQLINRASRVIKEANAKNYTESLPLGAILLFCAGAMSRLTENDLTKVHTCIQEQLNGQPFICPFTFGEQGRFTGGQIAHGNLMISAVMFYESE